MQDRFREEVVTRRSKSLENALYYLATVFMILAAVYSLFMLNVMLTLLTAGGFKPEYIPETLLTALMLAAAVLIFLYRDRIRTEFEYTFTNGTMDFAQVFNNRKRKTLGTMNVRNVEACGMVASGSFNRYLNIPGVNRLNWFLNRGADLFYFYFTKEGKKTLLVIEPSNDMQDLIRKTVGPGKYQTN